MIARIEMFEAGGTMVLCPECSHRFHRDMNNNIYTDCTVCGNRIYLEGGPDD